MDSTPPPVASQATTEGVLDPYNDCVYHLSNAYVYFPPQLASQIYTDGLVTSLRAKTINLESHYGDLMRDILQHLLGAKYTADEFAPGKRIIKVDAPFTGTAKWREGLTLNKRFHSSEGYNNIPAVREYRARNPAAQDSDRGSNSATSHKLGSLRPDAVLTSGDPTPSQLKVYHVLEYKYTEIDDPHLRQASLSWLRREGTYQTMWYIHVLGRSGRFRRRQGFALVNDRYLPLALADDGTILMQSDKAAGREVSIKHLDQLNVIWDERDWGNSFLDEEGMELFILSLRSAMLQAITDCTPPSELIESHRQAKVTNQGKVADVMVMKNKDDMANKCRSHQGAEGWDGDCKGEGDRDAAGNVDDSHDHDMFDIDDDGHQEREHEDDGLPQEVLTDLEYFRELLCLAQVRVRFVSRQEMTSIMISQPA